MCFVFFFKQKTAYVMRISDWSSDVCSSDLQPAQVCLGRVLARLGIAFAAKRPVAFQAIGQVGQLLRMKPDPRAKAIKPGSGIIGKKRPDTETRSEERRVGKEWVSTCRSRWSQDH